MTRALRPRDRHGKVIRPTQFSDPSTTSASASGGETVVVGSTAVPTATADTTQGTNDPPPPVQRPRYVLKERILQPPVAGMLSPVRQFKLPRHQQRHEGLPPAIATVLAIPELLDLIGRWMSQVLAEADPLAMTATARLTRWALAALTRTCQAWYAAFVPHLYREYVVRVKGSSATTTPAYLGLERHAHWIERVSVQMAISRLVFLALRRIHACCAVRDYVAGRWTWPGLVEEDEKKKEGEEEEEEEEKEEEKMITDEETQAVVVRTKSDLDRLTPEQLVVYVENNPLAGVKVGRVQCLILDGVSIDRRDLESKSLGIFIRSFPLKSLRMHQFSNCTWLPNETTVLGWWPQHFPTLESIRLQRPCNESPLSLFSALVTNPNLRSIHFDDAERVSANRNPLTIEQFKDILAVRTRRQANGSPGSLQECRLRTLSLPFQFLLSANAPRVRVPLPGDEGCGPVGMPLYFLACEWGRSLQHLTLTGIGRVGHGGHMTMHRTMTADDWVYLARHLPSLQILDLAVVYVPHMGMWAKAFAEFRRHCPKLHTIHFNAEPGLFRPTNRMDAPQEDLSTFETALLDIDLCALARCPDEEEEEGKEQEDRTAEENDDKSNVNKVDQDKAIDQTKTDSGHAVSSVPKGPTSVARWASVLRHLKLQGCRFLKEEGVLTILENCYQLKALNIRETRVATVQLFIGSTKATAIADERELPRWACTDSLEALAIDFGIYPNTASRMYNAEQEEQRQQRMKAAQHELDAWHGGPFPTQFTTVELLQIRRRLATLHRLRILHLGGPLMGFKIIARLADLQKSKFVGGSEDLAIQEALQGIRDRGGRETDSLLEHVQYVQVHVSLAHVSDKTKHWSTLSCWLVELVKGNHLFGSPEHIGSTPVFTILRRGRPPLLHHLPSDHPMTLEFEEQVKLTTL
ncbi:hypothetical protein BGZ73_001529 [Actinomortierella ambigua]|nr:hypothetical protein BGZ73_001529 [Actinomortierella ambigua]